MRVLLTGASGFLGQHVLHSFLTQSPPHDGIKHIHAIVNSSSGLDAAVKDIILNLGSKCSIQVGVEAVDLTDPYRIEAFFQRHPPMDVCIHTAALSVPRLCEQDPEQAARINNPTFLFDALIRSNTYIIALSTDQVYHGDPSQAPYSEADVKEPVNVYGHSKVAMEDYLLSNHPHRSALLRSSLILGPKAPILPNVAHDTFAQFIASRDEQETTFYTDECRSAVSVQDVVSCLSWFVNSACIACSAGDNGASHASTFPSGVYNLGGPASYSRMDLARAVFKWLEYDAKYLVPAKRAEQQLPTKSSGGMQQTQTAAIIVKSPLDISMTIDKLQATTGLNISDLSAMVKSTFPRQTMS